MFKNNRCIKCGYEKEQGRLFPDITDDGLRKVVEELADYGIINGYRDGQFKPFNNITRAEFSKMINTAMRVPFYELSENSGVISRKYSLKSLYETHKQ